MACGTMKSEELKRKTSRSHFSLLVDEFQTFFNLHIITNKCEVYFPENQFPSTLIFKVSLSRKSYLVWWRENTTNTTLYEVQKFNCLQHFCKINYMARRENSGRKVLGKLLQ
jgi:hypothetical protein